MVTVQPSDVATILVLRVHRGDEEVGLSVDSRSTCVAIGRDACANVRLQDPRVSRVHAMIYRRPEGLVLYDRSSNGTVVNGKSVAKQLLKDQDVISIAPYRVAVEIHQDRESALHENSMAEGWGLDEACTLSAA